MKATLIGILFNIILAAVKAAAGVFGNSYALIADAIESALDVMSSLLVYFGLKVSARPADDNHPHGHGKAEPLAALAVAGLLFAAAMLIARASILEILTPHSIPATWTLAVLVVVVAVKESLFRFAFKVGLELDSTAVKGDAWHHRSDALTSLAAFIGILIAIIGSSVSPDPRWSSADDYAALFASAVIALNGLAIFRNAIRELSDGSTDTSIEEEIRRIAGAVPGVLGSHKCFIRKMGFDYLVELDIRVNGDLSVREGHAIGHQVQDAICEKATLGRISRVRVHIEPN